MDRSPESSFEKEVVNEEEESFALSKDNMHALDALVAEVISDIIVNPTLKQSIPT
jgi:hypothetical protein